MKRAVLLVIALQLLACTAPSGVDEARTVARRDAIVGGTDAPSDIAVVELVSGSFGFCTGTLIAPRTVLTAAHCITSTGPGSYAVRFYHSGPNGYTTSSIDAAELRAHPQFDRETLENDVGVVRLVSAAPHAPAELTPEFLTPALVGEDVRHVGYGMGSAARDQVTYAIRELRPFSIESGAPGKQTCFGDSGGPAFVTLPGHSGEFLAGIVSSGDADCASSGVDQRVDVVARWIWSTAAAWEPATCGFDTQCKAGCGATDPDCLCTADDVCDASCGGIAADPDCTDCGANNVCSTAQCPQADPDCGNVGDPCTSAASCRGGVCATDPQHDAYCTVTCTDSTDCRSDMECAGGLCKFRQRPEKQLAEPCTAEDFCAGPPSLCAPDGICRQLCTATTRCQNPDEKCRTTSTPSYCVPADQLTGRQTATAGGVPGAPSGGGEAPEPEGGCATTPQSAALLSALALWRASTRRASEANAKRRGQRRQ